MNTRRISTVFVSAGLFLAAVCLSSCVQNTATPPAASTTAPSPAGETAASSGGGSVDAAAMLAAHNQWRAKYGVPALKWSDKLAGVAQKWVDHLAGSSCSSGHSGNEYGENIFMASAATWSDGRTEATTVTPQNAVDEWGNEVKDYDYSDNSCHSVCGHYTQVVWKDTQEVGCAMATCSNKSQLWVCNYYPAGNMAGKKPY